MSLSPDFNLTQNDDRNNGSTAEPHLKAAQSCTSLHSFNSNHHHYISPPGSIFLKSSEILHAIP